MLNKKRETVNCFLFGKMYVYKIGMNPSTISAGWKTRFRDRRAHLESGWITEMTQIQHDMQDSLRGAWSSVWTWDALHRESGQEDPRNCCKSCKQTCSAGHECNTFLDPVNQERGKKKSQREMFLEDKFTDMFKANYKWTVGSKVKGHPEVQAEWPSWGFWGSQKDPGNANCSWTRRGKERTKSWRIMT